jgi:uncharacterized oxidoreductase
MKLTDNTILITGGGSGIGRGLAQSFHHLGNQVIIAGRRGQVLQETCDANPGMQYRTFDQDNADEFRSFAAQLANDYPGLNAVINNAGIWRAEDLTRGVCADAEAMVTTNLLGPIRLTAALLPFLILRPRAALLNVTSRLAFVPLAMTPTYCALKAAMHSYTQSLRHQLKKTSVQVIELIPPSLQTKLHGKGGMDPNALPLDGYIAQTMSILKNSPDATEILVEGAKPLRFAEHRGDYDAVFSGLNDDQQGQ